MKTKVKRSQPLATIVLFVYMLMMVLPIMGISAVFITTMEVDAAQENNRLNAKINEQVGKSLDLIISEADQLSRLHTIRYDILYILRKYYDNSAREYVADYRNMADLIGVVASTNHKIYRFSYVSATGQIFSHFSPPYIEDEQALLKRVEYAKQSGEERVVFPPVVGKSLKVEDAFIPIVVRLRDPDTAVSVGFACIDIRYNAITDLYAHDEYSENINLMILNEGTIYYDSGMADRTATLLGERTKVGAALEDALKASSEIPEQLYVRDESGNAKQYSIYAGRNKATGWHVISYLPSDFFAQQRIGQILIYVMMVLFVIGLSLLVGKLVFKRFQTQMNVLSSNMDQVKLGQIGLIKQSSNTLEIQRLYESYNDMATKLNQSIEREYETRILQKKTEMEMLLLQINPHFLYNTLNLICSIAQCNGIEEIERISMCLSSMLRYSIQGPMQVKLDEEIRQVQHYITIQQLRFPDTVSIECQIDEELRQCSVIKFILQPIVENAFRHGLENRRGHRRLTLSIQRQNASMQIMVSDNGMGMEPTVLKGIQDRLREISGSVEQTPPSLSGGETQQTGIGLYNVHRRIVYTFGSEFGVNMESWHGEGTVVTIKLPILF